jgi:hypothetical protein
MFDHICSNFFKHHSVNARTIALMFYASGGVIGLYLSVTRLTKRFKPICFKQPIEDIAHLILTNMYRSIRNLFAYFVCAWATADICYHIGHISYTFNPLGVFYTISSIVSKKMFEDK